MMPLRQPRLSEMLPDTSCPSGRQSTFAQPFALIAPMLIFVCAAFFLPRTAQADLVDDAHAAFDAGDPCRAVELLERAEGELGYTDAALLGVAEAACRENATRREVEREDRRRRAEALVEEARAALDRDEPCAAVEHMEEADELGADDAELMSTAQSACQVHRDEEAAAREQRHEAERLVREAEAALEHGDVCSALEYAQEAERLGATAAHLITAAEQPCQNQNLRDEAEDQERQARRTLATRMVDRARLELGNDNPCGAVDALVGSETLVDLDRPSLEASLAEVTALAETGCEDERALEQSERERELAVAEQLVDEAVRMLAAGDPCAAEQLLLRAQAHGADEHELLIAFGQACQDQTVTPAPLPVSDAPGIGPDWFVGMGILLGGGAIVYELVLGSDRDELEELTTLCKATCTTAEEEREQELSGSLDTSNWVIGSLGVGSFLLLTTGIILAFTGDSDDEADDEAEVSTSILNSVAFDVGRDWTGVQFQWEF